MSEVICIGRGTATLGRYKANDDGTTAEIEKAHWEPEKGGGSVGIFKMDADTNKVLGAAEVFGDWQAAEYLERVLELLGPGRPNNLPPLREIVRSMTKDRLDGECPFLEHCAMFDCRDCIVNEWVEDEK